jgi:hypothetical protein
MASGKTMNETVLEDLALHDVISAPTPRKAVA